MKKLALRDVKILAGIFFFALCSLFVLHTRENTVRAQANPAGTHAATAADLEWMRAAGIPEPAIGELVDPSNPEIGQAAGEAKLWLSQHASRGANIGCLDPQFAQKLKAFMMSVPGGTPTITDGYR